jgi:hypothetical protein
MIVGFSSPLASRTLLLYSAPFSVDSKITSPAGFDQGWSSQGNLYLYETPGNHNVSPPTVEYRIGRMP